VCLESVLAELASMSDLSQSNEQESKCSKYSKHHISPRKSNNFIEIIQLIYITFAFKPKLQNYGRNFRLEVKR
jgi:hypothetical protein